MTERPHRSGGDPGAERPKETQALRASFSAFGGYKLAVSPHASRPMGPCPRKNLRTARRSQRDRDDSPVALTPPLYGPTLSLREESCAPRRSSSPLVAPTESAA